MFSREDRLFPFTALNYICYIRLIGGNMYLCSPKIREKQ